MAEEKGEDEFSGRVKGPKRRINGKVRTQDQREKGKGNTRTRFQAKLATARKGIKRMKRFQVLRRGL